jgi:hypothetical protein
MASGSAVIATHEFDAVLSNFIKTLSPKEKAEFQFTTIEDVYQEMERIQQRHEKEGCLRYLRRIAPFIDGMARFMEALKRVGAATARPDILAFLCVSRRSLDYRIMTRISISQNICLPTAV